MENLTPIGSQENALSSQEASTGHGEEPGSSPVLPQLPKEHGSKQRKPPTITPRSFTRFFTPKSSLERSGKIGASRQALRDITASASNRRGRRTPTKDTIKIFDDDLEDTNGISRRKKRKVVASIETTPDRSSPLKRIRNQSLDIAEDGETDAETVKSDDEPGEHLRGFDRRHNEKIVNIIKPITGSQHRHGLGRDLRREIGTYGRITKARSPYVGGSKDWQYETTNFFTRPEDSFVSMNVAAPSEYTNPFCTASCNTNSLVAIGDEDGGVQILESAEGEKLGFSKPYLAFQPHKNAILDLAFSHDDLLLATASGDQTSQIIDMPSQRASYILEGHVSSVKQIRFQPGSSSVIATSSRDGSVQIWDLRCKGYDGPVRDIRVNLESSAGDAIRPPVNHKSIWARSVNTIFEAHAGIQSATSNPASNSKTTSGFDAPSKTESPGRRGDVSITALAFLHPGREHLLMTGSEANASVKLWDLRTTHNHRRSRASPLSSTQQPESHTKHRHFGLTSLSLSGDGGRLYTLCRDNTVYAYSTAHLILGNASELSKTASKPRRSGGSERQGLGPLYGFRHPRLHATTFYVKSVIRPAKDDRSELLAVGSSDGCPIIFPTDERYMQRSNHQRSHPSDSPFSRPRPALTRTDSGAGLLNRLEDTIPIYQHGSALIRGHTSEVTGLSWTHGGELVTVGDDCTVRCWREGSDARDLRMGGEREGRRWQCGWAEADEAWDGDDG